jgi:NTP pyrophosphatase (non-canonical NTP hydrolase)
VELAALQDSIRRTYLERDAARGLDGTFRWLVEEVGELARALRHEDGAARAHEVSDVIAWVLSVANLAGVRAEEAMARYANGCPRCDSSPCRCPQG